VGLLPLRHFLFLVTHGRRLVLHLVADGSLMHHAVIDLAADSKRLIERSLLRVIGVQSTLYTEPVHGYLIPQHGVKMNKRDINIEKEIYRLRNPNKTLRRCAISPATEALRLGVHPAHKWTGLPRFSVKKICKKRGQPQMRLV